MWTRTPTVVGVQMAAFTPQTEMRRGEAAASLQIFLMPRCLFVCYFSAYKILFFLIFVSVVATINRFINIITEMILIKELITG